MKVALIACCAAKLTAAAPASQLYRSALFQKSKRYAEMHCDEFAILSAKYGLVLADQVIEPYDLTLNGMKSVERVKWADRVARQLVEKWPTKRCAVHFVMLAGGHYRRNLVQTLDAGYQISVPMEGMAIGKQLQWLGRHSAE